MDDQLDKDLDFSQTPTNIPAPKLPPEIKPIKHSLNFRENKKLIIMIGVVLVLAIIQIIIMFSNRPPKATPKNHKTTTKATIKK